MSYKWPLVAVCGKFQPFHVEHLKYVLKAFEVGEHAIIGITNPDPTYIRMEETDPQRSTSEANPFTYYERYMMVVGSLRDYGIDPLRYDIVPFPINVPGSWFNYIPKHAVFLLTLYDEDKWLQVRKRKLEDKGIRTEVLWSKPNKGVVGAEVRRRIRAGLEWEELVPQATSRVIKDLGLDISIPAE
jgi:nicotinamide mononucleotide adenylyltransferase